MFGDKEQSVKLSHFGDVIPAFALGRSRSIMVSEMRNLFDQYSQPENRVTHALMTAVYEDRNLLRSFLTEVANCTPPKAKQVFEICEQTYPGQPEPAEDETDRRGIPDAWITNGEDWCLVIENKVLDAATTDQLTRHLAMARRLGFADPKALVLTVRDPVGDMPPDTLIIKWRRVYHWLIERAEESRWARRVSEFLEHQT